MRKLIILLVAGGIVSVVSLVYFQSLPSSPLKKPPIIESQSSTRHFDIKAPEFLPEPLSLEKVFAEDHGWVATLSAERVRTLVATGDVIPARAVNFKTTQLNNFLWPFEKTAEVLESADLTLINLESPLVDNCPVTTEGMIFCGDPRHIEGLVFAGVDVANLANNHLENWGVEGVEGTASLLERAEILPIGINNPQFKEMAGLKVAFLGYDDTGAGQIVAVADREKVVAEIKQAKELADLVVVSFHWGEEYTAQPTERQKELAHLAIDSGADLIIGNHPHWLQPVEIYKNKLIVYSHGNFIFDQMWSEETKIGLVGRYTFYDEQLIDVEFLPVYITDYGQPEFLEGERKEEVLGALKRSCLSLIVEVEE